MARASKLGCFAAIYAFLTALCPVAAQVSLTMSKSGSDVVLSWSGGSGPYDVIRSTAFRMSADTQLLATGSTGAGFTDTDALVSTQNPPLYCYIITDVAARPALNITSPCDSPGGGPPCTVNKTTRNEAVSGTTNSANPVYVNDRQAAPSPGAFSAGVDLFLGLNRITAATRNAAGDWSVDFININRQSGNQAPVITVTTPAHGTTIYDPTPLIQVDYSDPDGAGEIVTTDFRVYIDGKDRTIDFTVGAAQATYQMQASEGLSAGTHFIYATIRDFHPYGSSATSNFTVSDPVIGSFGPAAEGKIGDTITISGTGFDATIANNAVTFNGVTANISAASTTSLDVVVPAGAQTGPVLVSVGGRASKGKSFRVLLATTFLSISSVAVDPAVSNHVFFTDRSTNDQLYEVLADGTIQARCGLNDATGLPVDSSGNLYFGIGASGSTTGQVARYLPASNTCPNYVQSKLIGEASANVFGAALTEVGGLSIYLADNDNGKIKRIDPALAVTSVASGQVFTNPAGLAVNSTGGTLYFSSGNNIRSIPVPGGGTVTTVKTVAGGPKGLAITPDNKLVVARSTANAVSWLDPGSSSNPFWDLATGLSAPQVVAVGDPTGSPFVVVGENTRVYRIPRPSVVLSDAADQPLPSKVVADFAPLTTDCLGSNVLTLKVKFSPTTLIPDTTPRQLVTWTVVDPDDPSDDPAVDINDTMGSTGGDNRQLIGSYTQWEAVTGFAPAPSSVPTAPSFQTEIVGGVSQVKFHLSCQPGDNYRFVGQVTVPVYGVTEETSDILTMWRRLHVESDSMGPAAGPFDADDAELDDVPDGVYDHLMNAFRAAYVEVALPPDTGADTPDVRFQYNVDSPTVAINAQGVVGRATTSTAGYWVVYHQGGYEGAVGRDNDPDNEADPSVGIASQLGGRYGFSFFETVRDTSAEGFFDTGYVNATVPLHEIGHQFGLADVTGCVMTDSPIVSPVFCGAHLRAIRGLPAPSTQ